MTDTRTAQNAPQQPVDDLQCRMAVALSDLVAQINMSDFKDGRGQKAKNLSAFKQAHALAEQFGFDPQELDRAFMASNGKPEAMAALLCNSRVSR